MESANPLVKTQELKEPPPKYPITVKCVVASLSEKIPDILKIRDFAHSMNINFMTREYNSTKYSDDRHSVTRLPAFHIYLHNGYQTTFYLNTRPYQIIQEIVQEYEEAKERKRLKRTWHTFYTELRAYLKAAFRPTGITNARWSGGCWTIYRAKMRGNSPQTARLNCPAV